MKYTITRFLVSCFLVAQLSACDKDFLGREETVVPPAPLPAMADYLKYNYSFSMLYGALQKAGLIELLSDTTKRYTLMAPDNTAFANAGISQDSLNKLEPAYLRQWLSYHLLPGKLAFNGIPAILNSTYTTINGQTFYISKQPNGGAAAVNSVKINGTAGEIPVCNGAVYVLESTLWLPAASIKEILTTNPIYSRFGAALAKFGLLDKLEGPGPFVVLATNNNRFMSEDELATIDTVAYRKYLFESHIMQGRFFFHTDFQYRPIPESSTSLQYFIGSDGVLVIDNDASFFAAPLTAGPNPYYYAVGLGDQISLQYPPSKSLLALNGIVIDCPGSLVYPYNMMKQ
jgi:uncharacterized surface protein with fasciclin (FAS1) repeats